jgi:hypothetical protein
MSIDSSNKPTYRDAVNVLRTFYSGASAASAQRPSTPAAKLRLAIVESTGDWKAGGRADAHVTPPGKNQTDPLDAPVSNAVWRLGKGDPTFDQERPLFGYADIGRALATIAFVIPEAGALVSAGVTVLTDAADRMGDRLTKMREAAQAEHPSESDADRVVANLIAYFEDKEVGQTIRNAYSTLDNVERAIDAILPTPSPGGPPRGSLLASPEKRKGASLREVGQVFALLDHELSTLQNQTDRNIDHELRLGLRFNPKLSEASATDFAAIAARAASAMFAYTILALHPPEAFTDAGWDASSFDPVSALRQRGQDLVDDNLPTAGDALAILAAQIDAFLVRMESVDSAWQKIDDRLNEIQFDGGQPAKRDKLWYLEKSRTVDETLSVRTLAAGVYQNRSDPAGLVGRSTSDLCHGDQVAVTDPAIDAAPEANDRFLDPVRTFHTTATFNWSMDTNWADTVVDTVAMGLLGRWATQDYYAENYPSLTYPITADMSPASGGYPDCFWTPAPSAQALAALSDATQPGFLDVAEGRDIVAWMAMVLEGYARAYRFSIEPANGITSMTIASDAAAILKALRAAVSNLMTDAAIASTGSWN